jgi:hypothetical protein
MDRNVYNSEIFKICKSFKFIVFYVQMSYFTSF